MRAKLLNYLLLAAPIIGGSLAAAETVDGRDIDDYCVEDRNAVEGWYLNSSRRGDNTSYLILQKKQRNTDRFYLCRLDGDERFFIRELGIRVDAGSARIEAARCTPVESGVPGNEYFSVIDNRTAHLLRVYRFDAIEEDIESMPAQSVVCSSLPAS